MPKWTPGEWRALDEIAAVDAPVRIEACYQTPEGLRATAFIAICDATLQDNFANATLMARSKGPV